MKIKSFVQGYKKAENKSEFINSHITGKYVPFETKEYAARSIIDLADYIQIGDTRVYQRNSVSEKYGTDLWMVRLYTDLELDKNGTKILADYNLLGESGALYEIRKILRDECADFKEFEDVVWSVSIDESDKNNSIPTYLDSKLQGVSMFLGELLNMAEQAIQSETGQTVIQEVTKKVKK